MLCTYDNNQDSQNDKKEYNRYKLYTITSNFTRTLFVPDFNKICVDLNLQGPSTNIPIRDKI